MFWAVADGWEGTIRSSFHWKKAITTIYSIFPRANSGRTQVTIGYRKYISLRFTVLRLRGTVVPTTSLLEGFLRTALDHLFHAKLRLQEPELKGEMENIGLKSRRSTLQKLLVRAHFSQRRVVLIDWFHWSVTLCLLEYSQAHLGLLFLESFQDADVVWGFGFFLS